MPTNFHNSSTVKLRKSKQCEWCGGWLAKGEQAYRGTGNFDGEFYDYRMHLECAEAMKADPDVKYDGFMPYECEKPTTEATKENHVRQFCSGK